MIWSLHWYPQSIKLVSHPSNFPLPFILRMNKMQLTTSSWPWLLPPSLMTRLGNARSSPSWHKYIMLPSPIRAQGGGPRIGPGGWAKEDVMYDKSPCGTQELSDLWTRRNEARFSHLTAKELSSASLTLKRRGETRPGTSLSLCFEITDEKTLIFRGMDALAHRQTQSG